MFLAISIWGIFKDNEHINACLIILYSSLAFLMIFIEIAKRNYVNSEYTQFDTDWGPPEDDRLQALRYLKFRKQITEMDFSCKDISNVITVLDSRENLEEVSGTYVKRFGGVVLTVGVGLAITIFRLVSTEVLALISISLIAITFFVYQIVSLIPARIERIRELHYFLTMLQEESNTKND